MTDDGAPVLGATQSFSVVVRDSLSDLVLARHDICWRVARRGCRVLNATLEVTNLSFVRRDDAERLTNLTVQAAATGSHLRASHGTGRRTAGPSLCASTRRGAPPPAARSHNSTSPRSQTAARRLCP